MSETKLEAITKLFEGNEIRSIWDEEKQDYYFSVVDVISVLTNSKDSSDYWTTLKRRLVREEKSELPTFCRKLKMKTSKGRNYPTDVLDTKGILRLIESVPSPKAEPFKLWLANLGKERIDEVFDPEIAINRAVKYYRNKGYTDTWIEKRLKGILDRNKLTDVWKEGGIEKDYEYALLTNEIYKVWSGMTACEYKKYKGLRKESLRDNMDAIELILTDLSEEATKRLADKKKPKGLRENIKIAHIGGSAYKVAKTKLEENLDEDVVTKNNKLNYEYLENQNIKTKEKNKNE